MNIRDFAGDKHLEENGKWFEFEDAQFLIAANGNARHRAALRRLGLKHQRAFRKKDDDAQQALVIEAMAEGVLLDWKNVKDGPPGQEVDLPFSKQNAMALLGHRIFLEFVTGKAMDSAEFLQEEERAALGDLKSGTQVESTVGA